MAPVRTALRYGDVREDGRGGFLFQKNFGTMGVLQYVPYDEWVKTIPAYERYRTESARMAGGIPEPAGTDVWRDIVLPKVAGMAISKGIGLGASSSVPSKVVSGSRGGGGGSSLSTGEALEEGGLDALTHSLIEKLMGGRGVSQGYTDLPSSASIMSQASAAIKISREKYAERQRQVLQEDLERKRLADIERAKQLAIEREAETERLRQAEEARKQAEAKAEAERLRKARLNQVMAMRPPGWEGQWPPPNWEAGFFAPTTDTAGSTTESTTGATTESTTSTVSQTTQPAPQPSAAVPADRATEYRQNVVNYYGGSETNPGFSNPITPTRMTPQAPSTGLPTPQGNSTLSQLPGVGLPSGGQTDSGFIGDVTGLKTKYDTTTDPEYSTSQMDALMASEAYNGTDTEPRAKRLGDYNLIEGLSTPRYAVYHNPENNQTYLSYRGTANLGDATGYWGKIIGGDLTKSERFQDALDIYDQVKQKYGTAPRLVGHSLGGSIVKGVIRERPNAIGVGFNAGSSIFGEDKELGKLCAQQQEPPSVCERFIHHRIEGDIVSMSAQVATTSNRLKSYASHNIGFNPIAPHLMNQFTDSNSPYWTQNAPRPTQMTGAYRPRPSLASRYLANPASFGDPLDNEEGILV